MSHTNTTTNFGLPQFITTDKPAWLTDVNVAYTAIDTAMKNNQTAAASAQSDASQALLDAASAGSTASTANSAANGAIASLADTFSEASTYAAGDVVIYNNLLYKCIANVEIPGPWTGSTNWSRTTLETQINDLDAANIEYTPGVSVKASLDSINGKLPNKDNITFGSNITGNIWYKKIDNMVWVCGNITTTGIIPVNTAIMSGFPPNNMGANNVIKAINNDGVSEDWVLYQGPSNANVLCAAAMQANKTFTVSYIYYTAI